MLQAVSFGLQNPFRFWALLLVTSGIPFEHHALCLKAFLPLPIWHQSHSSRFLIYCSCQIFLRGVYVDLEQHFKWLLSQSYRLLRLQPGDRKPLPNIAVLGNVLFCRRQFKNEYESFIIRKGRAAAELFCLLRSTVPLSKRNSPAGLTDDRCSTGTETGTYKTGSSCFDIEGESGPSSEFEDVTSAILTLVGGQWRPWRKSRGFWDVCLTYSHHITNNAQFWNIGHVLLPEFSNGRNRGQGVQECFLKQYKIWHQNCTLREPIISLYHHLVNSLYHL